MDKDNFLTKLENINEQLNLTHYWIIFLKYKKILLITTNTIRCIKLSNISTNKSNF